MEPIEKTRSFDSLRASEIKQIFEWFQTHESGSIIGVSNVGKSALFQHLFDGEVQKYFLPDDAHDYIFVRININNLPDFKNRSVYSLILDQLETLTTLNNNRDDQHQVISAIESYHDLLLNSDGDELKIQRYFKLAVRACLQEPARRLIFVFDQFDLLYLNGNNSLFYNLRGLHDSYPGRVIYLIFTRQPLPALRLDNDRNKKKADSSEEVVRYQNIDSNQQAREEFYELVQTNQLYLKPYSASDAMRMLKTFANQNHQPFDESLSLELFRLANGHAGLLRTCYQHALQNSPAVFLKKNNLPEILTIETISQECEKIWNYLNEEEQIALVSQVRHLPIDLIDQLALKHLELKGMIIPNFDGASELGMKNSHRIFSPLLEQFTYQQKTNVERPIYINWKSHTIYVLGSACEQLSKTEYLVFKTLYEQENTLVSVEDLFQLCYPDEAFDKVRSPGAITTMIHRIRQKLHLSEGDGLLQGKHKGYILHNRLKNDDHQVE
jgi:hypothetical protein